jgi:IclR family pca regulon transcriptional regulator
VQSTPDKPVVSEKDYLKTLAKGLELIRSFDGVASMTLSEVADINNLSRATARRHLHTLRHLGYMASDGDQFRLTPKILDIGHSFLASLSFAEALTPFMNDLSHQLSRPCSAAILDGDEIVYIQHIGRAEFISINLTVGSRLPAYATSIGHCLIGTLSDEEIDSFLDQYEFPRLTRYTITEKAKLKAVVLKTQTRGYALVDQQLELGLRSLAVPVSGGHGNVICGISVSRFNEDISAKESTVKYLPAMLETSAKIGATLANMNQDFVGGKGL